MHFVGIHFSFVGDQMSSVACSCVLRFALQAVTVTPLSSVEVSVIVIFSGTLVGEKFIVSMPIYEIFIPVAPVGIFIVNLPSKSVVVP